jgi:hypothetical protein
VDFVVFPAVVVITEYVQETLIDSGSPSCVPATSTDSFTS